MIIEFVSTGVSKSGSFSLVAAEKEMEEWQQDIHDMENEQNEGDQDDQDHQKDLPEDYKQRTNGEFWADTF